MRNRLQLEHKQKLSALSRRSVSSRWHAFWRSEHGARSCFVIVMCPLKKIEYSSVSSGKVNESKRFLRSQRNPAPEALAYLERIVLFTGLSSVSRNSFPYLFGISRRNRLPFLYRGGEVFPEHFWKGEKRDHRVRRSSELGRPPARQLPAYRWLLPGTAHKWSDHLRGPRSPGPQ